MLFFCIVYIAITIEFAYDILMINTAIIIKKLYPHDNKVALIDQDKGRINAILYKKSIIEGSLIQYSLKTSKMSLLLDDVEYLYTPLEWGKNDLLFFHHILEICYFFIPLYSCVEGIFNFLCFLFQMQDRSLSSDFQKIFLCKLFLILGIYPQTDFLKTTIAKKLFYISLEDMILLKIENKDLTRIDQWLKQCIMQHHMILNFKTLTFFKRAGK